MPDLSGWATFVDHYGLPLLIVFTIVPILLRALQKSYESRLSDARSASEKRVEGLLAEMAYREARRREERAGRIQAEQALQKMSDSFGKLSDGLQDVLQLVGAVLEHVDKEPS